MLLGWTGITAGEAVIYNEIRPLVDLRSPAAWYAAFEATSGRSMLLVDDLSEQGWTFPDPMSNRFGESDALDVVDQLAT